MSSDRFQNLQNNFFFSSVTYPAIWRCERISRGRCGVSCGRCGCECGGCASLKEMIHLQWETTASPAEDVVSPAGNLLASPNFGICDITQTKRGLMAVITVKRPLTICFITA